MFKTIAITALLLSPDFCVADEDPFAAFEITADNAVEKHVQAVDQNREKTSVEKANDVRAYLKQNQDQVFTSKHVDNVSVDYDKIDKYKRSLEGSLYQSPDKNRACAEMKALNPSMPLSGC